LLVGALVTACGDDLIAPLSRRPALVSSTPVITGSSLAMAWSLHTRDADSVAIRYGMEGDNLDAVTPAVTVAADTAVVMLLALHPSQRYDVQFVLFGNGSTMTTPRLASETGPLPDDLPAFNAEGPDPSPGLVVFGAGSYGLVIDNTGRVVWYHRFANGPGLAFVPTGNGTFATQPPVPGNPGGGPWVEVDLLGRERRQLSCAGGLAPRLHDIIVQPDGSYWIMCDEARTIDLSTRGGSPDARVLGTAVQHLDHTGQLRFSWSAFDHIDHATIDPSLTVDGGVTWTHGNSIALDRDGHLLVSLRNLSQVVQVDTTTGHVRWRLGGLHNDFTFSPTTSQAFLRQHGVRLGTDGDVILLDNLGEGSTSRVERYRLDQSAGSAILVSTALPDPPRVGMLGGSVQPLPGNRVLASFGNGGFVAEYEADGVVVWRITGDPGYIFRAERIASLYPPWH
jgi:hypothetical protein